jgi:hypothetical protein
MNRGIEKSVIHFGTEMPNTAPLRRIHWLEGEHRRVEFFPGLITDVLLTSVRDPGLPVILRDVASRSPLVLDIEWKSFTQPLPYPSLYQLTSSPDRVILIRDLDRHTNPELRSFLSSHSFVGKGTSCDIRQLVRRYGDDFVVSMEDVEETRLGPYGDPLNFEMMVRQFVGEPCTAFKRKAVSLSNWETRTLSVEQVLYAAYDVHALFLAYENFPPPKCYLLPFNDHDDGWCSFFKAALFEHLVGAGNERGRCPVCGVATATGDLKRHIWIAHADHLCQLFNFGSDIPAAVDSVNVTSSGKLRVETQSKRARKVTSFRQYRQYRQAVGMKAIDAGRFPVVPTFCEYLRKTGRLFQMGDTCALCGNAYGGDPAVHVWEWHASFLVEWLPNEPGMLQDFQILWRLSRTQRCGKCLPRMAVCPFNGPRIPLLQQL